MRQNSGVPRITGITGIPQIQKIRVETRRSKDAEGYTRYAGNKVPRITGITDILQIQKIRVKTGRSKDAEGYTRYAGNKAVSAKWSDRKESEGRSADLCRMMNMYL